MMDEQKKLLMVYSIVGVIVLLIVIWVYNYRYTECMSMFENKLYCIMG